MDETWHRYPASNFLKYTPGSKGLNKHFQMYREGPYGLVAKGVTRDTQLHKDRAVSQYVDQRGVPTFAYKIPSLTTWKTAPYMARLPRGGTVPRIVGELGDDDGSVSTEYTGSALAASYSSGAITQPIPQASNTIIHDYSSIDYTPYVPIQKDAKLADYRTQKETEYPNPFPKRKDIL